jgi:hypothetical protein
MGQSRSDLGDAALELAAAGHPVLPLHTPTPWGCSCGRGCSRVGKHPRSTYGLKSATTDPERIEAWWFGQPEANVGMRCDGLVVFDTDGPEGRRALERLESELGELPPTRLQVSGRGEHRLYSTPLGASIGNSTAPLSNPPGLDLRVGSRGYVVAAPSLHESGVHYEWLDAERPIEPLPAAWVERLLTPKPEEIATAALTDSTPYGRAALRREMTALSRARPGARNNALNRAVYTLAGWVSGGELDWYELHDTARSVGLALGLPPDEVDRTICSAMNAGYARPRWKR